MNHQNRQITGFNFIAPFYEFLLRIIFGNVLRNMELRLINTIPNGKHILIIGEGNGEFLKKFLQQNQPVSITVVDLSDKMCKISQNKIESLNLVNLKPEYIISDIREFRSENNFDVLITNFFLDLFDSDDLKHVMSSCDSLLKSEGIWYITDFYDRSGTGLPSMIRKVIMIPIYTFFRLLTGISGKKLPDFHMEISALDYQLVKDSFHSSGLFRCAAYKKNPQF
jgi:ubiquinone/menaquinone biosynthesis C-methylase UbiE